MSDMIIKNKPFQFEGRFLAPKYRPNRTGDVHLLEIEVDEQLWYSFKALERGVIISGVIFATDGDPDPDAKPAQETPAIEPKPKREKKLPKPGTHENGLFWAEMRRLDWFNAQGLSEGLDCAKDDKAASAALKRRMGVSSRREIPPDAFEVWCRENVVESAITISRQARAKVEELQCTQPN